MALVLFVCTIGIFPFCSRPDQIAPSPSHSPFCPPLSGLEDALVILKTGATEALQKLPVHFQTTLRCVPHHVIFSDFEEVIAGREVHDSLDEVNKTIVDTSSPEFDLYRRLQSSGRDGLTPEESTVRTDGAAWKLDKWKFLPIIDKAIRRKPDARWYVFMEADTYISWTNLQHYIARLNASEMHYIGNQMEITQQLFAHGGSGFIVSNPAMRAASERRASQLPDYDRYTADQWAGDCVLGKAMEDIGSPILWAWPMFQGLTPSTLDYNGEAYFKRLWCYPAITYHHIGGDDIKSLFKFEREMYSQANKSLILHADVFKYHVLPEITKFAPVASSWDNLADGEAYSEQSLLSHINSTEMAQQAKEAYALESCHQLCWSSSSCVQYRLKSGVCTTSGAIKKGYRDTTDPSLRSGWMMDRIEAFVRAAGSCEYEDWVLP